jgi:hypothetical protein
MAWTASTAHIAREDVRRFLGTPFPTVLNQRKSDALFRQEFGNPDDLVMPLIAQTTIGIFVNRSRFSMPG